MKKIKQFYENLFFTRRFFLVMLGLATLFVISFAIEAIYGMVWFLFFCVVGFTLLELFFLFLSKNNIQVTRLLPEKLSNGDENDIYLKVRNSFFLKIYAQVIDELPKQFQSRDFFAYSNTSAQWRQNHALSGASSSSRCLRIWFGTRLCLNTTRTGTTPV